MRKLMLVVAMVGVGFSAYGLYQSASKGDVVGVLVAGLLLGLNGRNMITWLGEDKDADVQEK